MGYEDNDEKKCLKIMYQNLFGCWCFENLETRRPAVTSVKVPVLKPNSSRAAVISSFSSFSFSSHREASLKSFPISHLRFSKAALQSNLEDRMVGTKSY